MLSLLQQPTYQCRAQEVPSLGSQCSSSPEVWIDDCLFACSFWGVGVLCSSDLPQPPSKTHPCWVELQACTNMHGLHRCFQSQDSNSFQNASLFLVQVQTQTVSKVFFSVSILNTLVSRAGACSVWPLNQTRKDWKGLLSSIGHIESKALSLALFGTWKSNSPTNTAGGKDEE